METVNDRLPATARVVSKDQYSGAAETIFENDDVVIGTMKVAVGSGDTRRRFLHIHDKVLDLDYTVSREIRQGWTVEMAIYNSVLVNFYEKELPGKVTPEINRYLEGMREAYFLLRNKSLTVTLEKNRYVKTGRGSSFQLSSGKEIHVVATKVANSGTREVFTDFVMYSKEPLISDLGTEYRSPRMNMTVASVNGHSPTIEEAYQDTKFKGLVDYFFNGA